MFLCYSRKSKNFSDLTTLTKFPGTLANYQDEITEVFSKAVPQKSFEVFLFGSRARGDEDEGSDADLAINGQDINSTDLSLIREQWEYSTVPVQFDLVNMKDINAALFTQIEHTTEAFWKYLKHYLQTEHNLLANSPREVMRMGLQAKLYNEQTSKEFLQMLDDRNLTSHTYIEELATSIATRIPNYAHRIKSVLENL